MEKRDLGATFRFRKNDRVGEAEAESDDAFLFDCFIDQGDLDRLRDTSSPQRLVIGRTGSGKTALLRMIELRCRNVVRMEPENLALGFLSNSGVIRFFEEAGTNLDLFYQLLWRHVLSVELIKKKYRITNDTAQRTFLSSLSQLFTRDRAKEQAIAYLRDWGENFWNETEDRVKEITSKLEEQLKAGLGGSALLAKLEAGGSQKLSEEEKREVVARGARVVSNVQIKALADVLKLLGEEIFDDEQDAYYIVIDDLDSKWVEDGLKYRLIRALIETVKVFRQVKAVKIIVALRLDLFQRVVTATRDSGFQSEKYESLRLDLRWTKQQIVQLLDLRVRHLVKQRYTSRAVSMWELFPTHIGRVQFDDYLTQHTFLRPRDGILFVNECISRALDRGQIGTQIVHDAEGAYSQKRLDSLQEEWGTVYPLVTAYLQVFARRPTTVRVRDLSEESMREWVYDRLLSGQANDPVAVAAQQCYVEGSISSFRFTLVLIQALYVVGAIGIKPDSTNSEYWSFYSDHVPSDGEIRPTSILKLHPIFWRAVGARPV